MARKPWIVIDPALIGFDWTSLFPRLGGRASLLAAVTGTSAGELLPGTSGIDTIFALSGNDTVLAKDGSDTLYGGAGSDELYGETGNDIIDSGEGSDTLYGGAGNDTLTASNGVSAGTDFLFGGDGNDTLTASDEGNTLYGDGGDDTVFGGSQGDALYGGSGNDTLNGGNSRDVLYGGEGNELFFGATGQDTFFGDTGSDRLETSNAIGASTNLQYDGGSDGVGGIDSALFSDIIGNNSFSLTRTGPAARASLVATGPVTTWANYSGVENITVSGQAGNDSLLFTNYASGADAILSVSLYGGAGNDTVTGTSLVDNVILGGVGGSGVDRFLGHGGIDQFFGGSGVDTLIGLSGNDTLDGGASTDSLFGGDGADTIFGQDSNDVLNLDTGADVLAGGSGNDTLFWDASDTGVTGGSGIDTLVGTAAKDVIGLADLAKFSNNPFELGADHHSLEVFQLGAGNDTIFGATQSQAYTTLDRTGLIVFGGLGDDSLQMKWNTAVTTTNTSDTLFGGSGNDSLFGDSGKDYLHGGKGNDSLFGGAGIDQYHFGRGEGIDRIVDTSGANGLALFAGFTSNNYGAGGTSYNGVDPTEVSFLYGATDVTVFIDSNDNGLFTDETSYISFAKGQITTIEAVDYSNNDAGNGTTAPPTSGPRDLWDTTWNGTSFGPWVKILES